MKTTLQLLFGTTAVLAAFVVCCGGERVFPHKMPESKPGIPLSAAMERMFDYPTTRLQDNELFSQFKYTRLKGFDYHDGDGTVSRRDPSRPILVNGRYSIWYTERDTSVPPIGASRANEATDTVPSTDWELCDLWYATSTDGTARKRYSIIARVDCDLSMDHRDSTLKNPRVWHRPEVYFE